MTGVHAASFWVGGTVPGYAWGEGKRERAAVRSKKFRKGTVPRQCISIPAHDFVPLHFSVVIAGRRLGPGGFRQYWHRSFICRNLWVGGQDAPRERDSSDVRGASGRKAECGSGSVKSEFCI